MLNDVAAAAPDGRHVALVSFPALVTALYDNTPRYRVDSFAYVGLLTDEPYTVFVGTDTPYRSLRDLVEAARAQPEAINIAGAGIGSAPHLALMAIERAAGVRFTWVPTQGAGQAMQLVQGGHVAGSISTVSLTVRAHIQGTLRVVAIMERERWDKAPDLPTGRGAGRRRAGGLGARLRAARGDARADPRALGGGGAPHRQRSRIPRPGRTRLPDRPPHGPPHHDALRRGPGARSMARSGAPAPGGDEAGQASVVTVTLPLRTAAFSAAWSRSAWSA